MSVRVFIDGAAGTTGLEIRERLQTRGELSLVALDDKRRKDASARADALNDADMVILCLPDAAAREAVTLIVNPNVRVIDPSSAHRVTEGWVFGFPELEAKAPRGIAARHARHQSGLLFDGFSFDHAAFGAQRHRPARCGGDVQRDIGLFRRRAGDDRRIRGCGCAQLQPRDFPHLWAQSRAQAYRGDARACGPHAQAAVRAERRALPSRHAGGGPAAIVGLAGQSERRLGSRGAGRFLFRREADRGRVLVRGRGQKDARCRGAEEHQPAEALCLRQ